MHALWGEMDRRLLIKLGTAGLAAMALPGAAKAMAAQGFTHGVASGEPGANSVLLWTRYAAASDTSLTAEMSERADFGRIAGGGTVVAAGDSYNDTAMLGEAHAGILFHPPENVVREFPQFPVTRDFDALRREIDAAFARVAA